VGQRGHYGQVSIADKERWQRKASGQGHVIYLYTQGTNIGPTDTVNLNADRQTHRNINTILKRYLTASKHK